MLIEYSATQKKKKNFKLKKIAKSYFITQSNYGFQQRVHFIAYQAKVKNYILSNLILFEKEITEFFVNIIHTKLQT